MVGNKISACRIFLAVVLAVCTFQMGDGNMPEARNTNSCEKQRKVLTDSYGIITDGPADYPEDSHCEWLIKASNKKQFITLQFQEMETECSYDHIYVHDGDSYNSPLLASFSGSTLPTSVTSRSGAMLILLYSDTNYIRMGFVAIYSVTDCPRNCSSHGQCSDHICTCDRLWAGEACDISLCPDDCGEDQGWGQCQHIPDPIRCVCNPGYSGDDCSMPDSNLKKSNTWHLLAQEGTGLTPRAGLSGVYLPSTDRFYVYGGFTFEGILGDLLAYDFNTSRWTNLSAVHAHHDNPGPLWGHAIASYANNFVLYGGEDPTGNLSDRLWLYNVNKSEWHLEGIGSADRPPPLSKHTLTLVDGSWLYVFGGSFQNASFSSAMYRINLKTLAQWERVIPRGGKELDRRVVGHTAIYYPPAKTIFVYGGITVDFARFSRLSNQLHAFHVEKRYWTRISGANSAFDPLERAFHSALLVGDYMVVYGGYTHRHSQEEICYDNKTHIYHMRCHQWINLYNLHEDVSGSKNPITQGVISHAAGLRKDHTMIIAGGYSGAMRGSLLGFVLPPAVTARGQQQSGALCSSYTNKENCYANPCCGWCFRNDQGHCMDRILQKDCERGISASPCPGLCPALHDCHSCLIWGEALGVNVIGNGETLDHFPQPSCAWCVQVAQCHATGDPSSVCLTSHNMTRITVSNVNRQSGLPGIDITMVNDCRTRDFQAGLTFLKFRHPVNWEQPDEVLYVNQTSEKMPLHLEFSREKEVGSKGENVAKLLGFLRPISIKPDRISNIQLAMGHKGGTAVLWLSNDTSQEHLELIANHTSMDYHSCNVAERPSHVPLFSHGTPNQKYLLEFIMRFSVAYNGSSSMQLMWNAFSSEPQAIPVEFVEPYKNGSCYHHTSCLACLVDAACGWCRPMSQCLPRLQGGATGPLCQKNGESHFLVTHPEDCTLCSNFIYCEDCVRDSHCEWLVEEAFCVRRGRVKDAVQQIDLCPVPCHFRSNCTSCLGDPGQCAWCEATQTCFLFATYTAFFMYGRCREWVDENRTAPKEVNTPGAQCKHCTRHSACKKCLQDLSCGWCGNRDNPSIGICVAGDFGGPLEGDCSTVMSAKFSNFSSELTDWSYSSCPDVEECRLGLHDCHPNATCTNTPDSYFCTCNHGFKGDGSKSCIRTCSEECIHGYCSEAPNYQCLCNLGWTGADCTINCGCNNHSTCLNGTGQCDKCEDWTEGQFCERCRPGSYGNATISLGCQMCNCNGHANASQGYCKSTTGVCYCQDNTEGPNCERCKAGFYGDPRDGGHCFLECQPRRVLTNVVMGRLGSQPGIINPAHCLWILTVHDNLHLNLLSTSQSNSAAIQFTVHSDMKIKCPHNHLYVYDGLPDYIAPKHHQIPLGAFCSMNLSKPITVFATSGFLTVYFKRTNPNYGFNATYERLECPDMCSASNRTCHQGKCVCQQGLTGYDCSIEMCPNNCSFNNGECDKTTGWCQCNEGYGGSDCSVYLKSSHMLWSMLFDTQTSSRNASLPSSRMGHSFLSASPLVDSRNLWLFGGLSLSKGALNDLFVYDTVQATWREIEPTERRGGPPPKRRFHGATIVRDFMYIYGGIAQKEVLGDFWKFSITDERWAELMVPSEVPPLGGLTLTSVDEQYLVLIGGLSPTYGFLEKVLEYDVEKKEWGVLNCTGAFPVGMFGHTAVYHPPTQTIYMYGGVVYGVDKATVSNELYAFHYPSRQWSNLPSDQKVNPLKTRPQPQYFHTAITTEKYMVVLGGRGNGNRELIDTVFAYIYLCNLWLPLNSEDIEVVGDPPMPTSGLSGALINDEIYLIGGFFGQTYGQLSKLTLPRDLCQLFTNTRFGCIHHTGCAFCSVYESSMNRTFCYSQNGSIPSSCYNPKGASEVAPGISCNEEWVEKRDCNQYSTCFSCVASWPSHPSVKQVCKWCSSCQQGRCIPTDSSCEKETTCNVPQHVVTNASSCAVKVCMASDCEKCGVMPGCLWTRQAVHGSEWSKTLNMLPIYNWTCVHKTIQKPPSFNTEAVSSMESMPPLQCPPHCSQHNNCISCLDSVGGEGGWHECHWSEGLQQCVSPNFELLYCDGGSCGPVLSSSSASCPVPCWEHTQAAHCLSYPQCGWCAFSGPAVDGRGLCMKGGILGPTGGKCQNKQMLLFDRALPANVSKWLSMSEGSPFWAYLERPPENECKNGHHDCDERHEECVDSPDGFDCKCKQGYVIEGKQCKPVCSQGCVFGTCIEPDVCQCHFGYVGKNCSTQCDCNRHSDCSGPDRLSDCLECHNNTQGNQCQKCKRFYVGNPINGGKCIPCQVYCNGHSSICVSPEIYNSTSSSAVHPFDQLSLTELLITVREGALDEAICIGCQNNTEGNHCDQCVAGYFKAGESIRDGCRLCECHGHGDMCNPLNGENCNCQNNTENNLQCSQKNSKNIPAPCWQLQCSKCKEYFLGVPTHGHQCYRHVFLEKDYCFDPNTQDGCNNEPAPMLQGRTVFFAVQPRYMNVDIRIVVDVTEGGADFYFSAKDDTFVVEVNKTTGVHYVSVDKKYGIDIGSGSEELPSQIVKTKDRKMGKRETMVEDLFHELVNSSDAYTSPPLQLHETEASGLTTYITITDPHEFLLVRRLMNRLVITIPQEVHDLRTTRFYMVLRGVGSKSSQYTYGSLFFRQDQTRIDLFVFFSVFFSCFFLFLAICVVIWKVKQAFDVRRARRLHAAEMKHMASRPFGQIIAVIEDEPEEYDLLPYSPTNYRKKSKHGKGYMGRDSPKILTNEKFGFRPMAIEPTGDGIGAVATVLVQLPGGLSAPVRLSLASALSTVKGMHLHSNTGIRAAMRRRTSHVTL